MEIHGTHSCALGDLAHIKGDTPEQIVRHVWDNCYVDTWDLTECPTSRFLTFVEALYRKHTGVESIHYGEALAAYIRKHRLGLVNKSAKGRNPGHNSTVTVYTWRLSDAGMKRWAEEQKLPKAMSRQNYFA